MAKVKRKYKFNFREYIFPALYVVEFLGAALIGFFGKSFFAYEAFNTLWANIFYILFISALYITAFVQEVLASRATCDVLTNGAVFVGGMITCVLMYIFANIFTFVALAFSAIMTAVIAIRYALLLRKDTTLEPDVKRILAVVMLLLFAMVQQLGVEYVNNEIWARSLIPAAILFVVASVVAVLLVGKIWTDIYYTTAGRIGNAICAVLILFFLVYMYCVTAIGVANCSFDGEPQKIECTVLEKHIQTGGTHGVTQFKIKIEIDSNEKWLNLPVTEYHKLSEGDTVTIDYYSGAFNLPYYTYGEKSSP
ncbi:MAG: hypothetical protein J1F68_04775 [Clostridiales bacterium]|nr:hypothetical protein [Clostridiales bacterium]